MRLKDLFWLFRKMSLIVPFWATISKISALENTGFSYYFADSAVFWYFYHRYLTNGNLLTMPFPERTQEDLSVTLEDLVHCHQQKIQKRPIFDILMTLTLEKSMIIRQMTPFFHLLFESYPVVYFIFAFQDPQIWTWCASSLYFHF